MSATRWWVVLALSVMLALIAVAFLVSAKWWWAIGPGGSAAFGVYRLVGARRSGRPLGAR